jgi:transcriptional regulator with XRE-family HTH domain
MEWTNHELAGAEESFIAEAQFVLHNLLNAKGVSRKELAKRLGVSAPRVSQMFSDNARNLTLRSLARVFHVLGEEPQITSATLAKLIKVRTGHSTSLDSLVNAAHAAGEWQRVELDDAPSRRKAAEANDNYLPEVRVAA